MVYTTLMARTPDTTDWGSNFNPQDIDDLNDWIHRHVHPKFDIKRWEEKGRSPRWVLYIKGQRNPKIKRTQLQDIIAWTVLVRVTKKNPIQNQAQQPQPKRKNAPETINIKDPEVMKALLQLMRENDEEK